MLHPSSIKCMVKLLYLCFTTYLPPFFYGLFQAGIILECTVDNVTVKEFKLIYCDLVLFFINWRDALFRTLLINNTLHQLF